MHTDDKKTVWGTLFVLVGAGGAGKNALMRQILENDDSLTQLATATTRPIRPTEKQGREHLFISLEAFQAMITNNELLEFQEVTKGKFYGIPRASVENHLKTGADLIADIEVMGARVLRNSYREHVYFIYIDVLGKTDEEKLAVLKARMSNTERNEKADLIAERLQRAIDMEFPFRNEADAIIVNDEFDAALEQLKAIIAQRRLDEQKKTMTGEQS